MREVQHGAAEGMQCAGCLVTKGDMDSSRMAHDWSIRYTEKAEASCRNFKGYHRDHLGLKHYSLEKGRERSEEFSKN